MTLPSSLPIWVTLLLRDATSAAELCARAGALGVDATPTVDGIQLPHGFLALLDPQPMPRQLLDLGASHEDFGMGAQCLHLRGGARAGAKHEPRQAAIEVERLTGLLRALCPLAEGVVFVNANDIAFAASEFLAASATFAAGADHFPLYVFTKVRAEDDGPYASAYGMALFNLPDLAMPLGGALTPGLATAILGELQRAMVAEGFSPDDGATFDTRIGRLRMEHVQGALFVVPIAVALDPAKVAVARYRFMRERGEAHAGVPGILHRVRRPGLVVDHHLRAQGSGAGPSFAVTNGLGLTARRGGSADLGDDRVELALMSEHVGPWATGWLEWVARALGGPDGGKPLRAFDRVVLEEPASGIAGCVLWPGAVGRASGARDGVHTWALVPILEEELATFRAAPEAQGAWVDERRARGDVEALFERWSRVAPPLASPPGPPVP